MRLKPEAMKSRTHRWSGTCTLFYFLCGYFWFGDPAKEPGCYKALGPARKSSYLRSRPSSYRVLPPEVPGLVLWVSTLHSERTVFGTCLNPYDRYLRKLWKSMFRDHNGISDLEINSDHRFKTCELMAVCHCGYSRWYQYPQSFAISYPWRSMISFNYSSCHHSTHCSLLRLLFWLACSLVAHLSLLP